MADPSSSDFWIEYLKGMLKPAAATAVVFMAVLLSFLQRLGLEGEMIYAVVRASLLQLSVIGFCPRVHLHPKERRLDHPRLPLHGLCCRVHCRTESKTCMMVGNAMAVTGVTMKKLREDLKIQKNLVETALALGATPRQATSQQVKRSLVIALSPVLDNAKTVGLISLPGAMTGMIMGGASPLEAIQLQIVVMNMLIAASTVSGIFSTYLCWPAFFTKAHQLETQVFTAD
ncbi:hypothetical protein J5N97_013972 [Dioscorea zingiberensis]|uniref:Uncharacterized protein n=1 Tax=Dioscorea zingiberensis TaxID=325984 RepID=A0A9D5HJC2_9LILI|nr:hypothetical protein J5N97_013972 [Dioscorea zingiberensis]